ncbi:HNH endonuclease [Bacillus gaemokensis]|uniref:HNH endonuclease n=1 Tax=Bacillus gaemokensis TaxID=574375 RepID=UPI00068D9D4B|nr:HNH endonuclease [Bacillus gaemokensis]KYG38152.1 hypothetical protein AZF08_20610 [Bacillus gaemokensis]
MKVCEVCGATSEEKVIVSGRKYSHSFLCKRHYNQYSNYGKITDVNKDKLREARQCSVCGKDESASKVFKGDKFGYKYLCKKHYDQMSVYGKILERTSDSQYTNSEIKTDEDTVYITLKNRRYEKIGTAMVDIKDLSAVKDKRWSMNKDGYVVTRVSGELKFLHHIIANPSSIKNIVVDHEDRNKLNNKRSNLRVIEKQKNHMNHSGYKNNKSGFTGVSQNKKNGKWIARIHINKKPTQIGTFDKIDDAIEARLKAELEHYGKEFAPQRHLFEKYGI